MTVGIRPIIDQHPVGSGSGFFHIDGHRLEGTRELRHIREDQSRLGDHAHTGIPLFHARPDIQPVDDRIGIEINLPAAFADEDRETAGGIGKGITGRQNDIGLALVLRIQLQDPAAHFRLDDGSGTVDQEIFQRLPILIGEDGTQVESL